MEGDKMNSIKQGRQNMRSFAQDMLKDDRFVCAYLDAGGNAEIPEEADEAYIVLVAVRHPDMVELERLQALPLDDLDEKLLKAYDQLGFQASTGGIQWAFQRLARALGYYTEEYAEEG